MLNDEEAVENNSRKRKAIIEMNWKAIDSAAEALEQVEVPQTITKSVAENNTYLKMQMHLQEKL